MEVALVTPKFNVREAYGGEVSVKLLADELVKRGVKVRIIAERVESSPGHEVRAVRFTPSAIAEAARGADVLHAYNMDGIRPALKGARKAKIPAIASANSYWAACLWGDMCWPDGQVCAKCTLSGLSKCYETRNPLTIGRQVPAVLGKLEVSRRTRTLSRFDRVIVLSNASFRQLAGAGVPERRMTVIPNMADPALPGPDDPLLPLTTDPHVLSVGALKHTKGHHVLVDAFPEVARRVPGAKLTIVGDGPERGPLAERIRARGATGSVTLAGRYSHEQLRDLYRAARAVAFPVLWHEPFGRVLLESFAMGAPLVVSDRGAPGEIVWNTQNGLVVPAGDARSLTEALVRILGDDKLAERLRAKGRETLKEYLPSAVLPRIVQVYEETVAEARKK